MKWDDLTEEQQQAAVTAVAQATAPCFCHSCMAVYEAMAKAVVESLPEPHQRTVANVPQNEGVTHELG